MYEATNCVIVPKTKFFAPKLLFFLAESMYADSTPVCMSPRPNWDPPPPLPQASESLPQRETHSSAGVGVPIQTTGEKA